MDGISVNAQRRDDSEASLTPQEVEKGTRMAENVELKKDIGPWEMTSIAFNICSSWAGLAGSLNVALVQGGPSAILYGIIVSSTLYGAIAFSMSELSSVYPTAGGQYHFVSILAPKNLSRGLSYVCGMLTNFSWISLGASGIMIFSQEVMTLASFYHPDFVAQPWHMFVCFQIFTLLILLYNLLAVKRVTGTYLFGFILSLSIFLGSFIAILIRSSPKASSTFVWGTFINKTGWSDGVCFLSSLLTIGYIYSGLDATMHLAEEAPNPRVSVPRASISAIGVGFVTAFAYAVAILYTISDLNAILSTTGFLPFQIFRVGLRSDAGAIAIIVASLVASFIGSTAVLQTSSRITWVFAKDNALVFSKHLQKVHPVLDVPIYSLIFNAVAYGICGCIYLGSSTAFNAILSSSVVLQQLSYLMPTALLVYRRRSEEFLPKDRVFRLPDWFGWTVNLWLVALSTILLVFFFFHLFCQ
ncbi:Choline transport protein [Cladobotryum mycophilum]|uniref:Choline transport protein n=1 Tax=Cladobotryum mycophilum TaxID=491253 RepID=A0ABR0SB38_9HYPO